MSSTVRGRLNDNDGHDLFPNTRAHVLEVSHSRPDSSDVSLLTNDELRRRMLRTIFGWHKEVDDLIREEQRQHPAGSRACTFLATWLGDSQYETLMADSKPMSELDWMLLTLSGIGQHGSNNKHGRAYASRLLESGDIHAAVTVMISVGSLNDAIKAYLTHKRYMEALILTCFGFPHTWELQADIARQWGEWAVQNGQMEFAVRCYACTGPEWPSFKGSERFGPPPSAAPGQGRLQSSVVNSLMTSSGGRYQELGVYYQRDRRQATRVVGSNPLEEDTECTCNNNP